MQYKIKLLNLKCYLSDEADGDEVYLKANGQRIWPVDGKYIVPKEENVPINLQLNIQKGDSMEIEIWDYDLLSTNDHLGSLTIHAEAHGQYENDFVKRGNDQSKYALEWEIG